MDTNKWKSVLVPRNEYEELKILSKTEGRTMSGQLRLMFKEWKAERKERLTEKNNVA